MSKVEPLSIAADKQMEATVAAYLLEKKGWQPGDFRLQIKEKNDRALIVWAIYLQDERSPIPGAGQSVILEMDRKDAKVTRELTFQ